jgi:hypothetical protein
LSKGKTPCWKRSQPRSRGLAAVAGADRFVTVLNLIGPKHVGFLQKTSVASASGFSEESPHGLQALLCRGRVLAAPEPPLGTNTQVDEIIHHLLLADIEQLFKAETLSLVILKNQINYCWGTRPIDHAHSESLFAAVNCTRLGYVEK